MTPEYAIDQVRNMNNQNNPYPSSDISDFIPTSKRVGSIDKNHVNMLNILSSANNASNNINTTAALDAFLESQRQQRRLSILAASASANNQDLHPSIDSEIETDWMSFLRAERRRSSLPGGSRSSNENILGDNNVLASLANKIRRNSLLGTSCNLGETLDNFNRLPGELGAGQGSMDLCNLSHRLNKMVGDHDDLGARSESTLGQHSGSNLGSRLDMDSELQLLKLHKMQQEEEDLKTALMSTSIMEGNGGSNVAQHQQHRRLSIIAAMNSVGANGDNTLRRGSLASFLCDDVGRQEGLLPGSSSHQSRRNDLLLGLEARRRTSLSFLNAANRRDSFTGSCSSRRGSFLGNTSNGGPASRNGSLIGAIGAGDAMFPGRTVQRRGSQFSIDPNEMEELFDDNGTASSFLGQSNIAALKMQLHDLHQAQMCIAANSNPSRLGRNISTMAAVDALRRLSNASECAMPNEKSAILGKPSQASSVLNVANLNDRFIGKKNYRFIKNDSSNNTGIKPEISNKDASLTDREAIDSSIAETTTEMFKAFSHSMNKSQISQKNIQQWDKKMGLKKSHSITMTKTTQSRKMLRDMFEQELRIMFGLIVDLSGKEEMGELKIKKKRGRKKGSKNKKKVQRDSCGSASSTGSINSSAEPKDGNFPDDKAHVSENEGKQRISKVGLKRGSLTDDENLVDVDEIEERGKRHRVRESSSKSNPDDDIKISRDFPKNEPLSLIKSGVIDEDSTRLSNDCQDKFEQDSKPSLNPSIQVPPKNIDLSWGNEKSSQLHGLTTLASCIHLQHVDETAKRNSDMSTSKYNSQVKTQSQEEDIISKDLRSWPNSVKNKE